MSFIAGYNPPGYLPESEPVEFDTAEEALWYLAAVVEAFWDSDQDNEHVEDADGRWLPVHTDLHNAPRVPFSAVCGDGHLAFWVEFAEPEASRS